MVERDDTEVLFGIDNQEALRDLCRSRQVHHDFGWKNGTRVNTINKVCNGCESICNSLFLLLAHGEAQFSINVSWDRSSQVSVLLCIGGFSALN